jgi:UDP-3-O-[3-hydroxymyristoyl] glucosamine N-acyltransferase
VARTAQLGTEIVLGDHVQVAARARIGDGTSVGSGTTIGTGAQIGHRARIGENVAIDAGAIIPDDAVVLSGSHVSGAHGIAESAPRSQPLRSLLSRLFDLDDTETTGRKKFWSLKSKLH